MVKSYDSLAQDPLADLLANCSHHTSSRVRAASTQPNPSYFTTDTVGEKVIEADAAMEDVALGQPQQVLQVERSQDVHVMDIQRFLEILSNLLKKNLANLLMRDRRDDFSIVGMIRRVLHETIHDVISLGAKSVIIHAGNGEIHEWSETDAVSLGLVVSVHQKVHRVAVQVDRAAKQVLGCQFVAYEGFELGQFAQGQVDLGSSTIVLYILEFVVEILREVVLCVFDKVEKGHLVGAVTKDYLRFEDFSVLQFHRNRTALPIVHDLLNLGVEFDLRPHLHRVIGQDLGQSAVSALNVTPLALFTLLQLTHHVMQQHISSRRMRNRQILANDAVGCQRGLEDVGLEPVVEHIFHRGSHEPSELEVVKSWLI